MKKIAVIGECMVELYQQIDGKYHQSFSGDSFNFAAYLKQELESSIVEYITVLGEDKLSSEMLNFFKKNKIGCSYIELTQNKIPGLYIIQTKNGERLFNYWRENSAARDLFTTKKIKNTTKQLQGFNLIYFSAITLAIMSQIGIKNLFLTIEQARKAGVKIAFDSNYRKNLYPSKDKPRELYEKALRCCDIFLPSFADESALWQDNNCIDVINRAKKLGCSEIIVTQGDGDVIYCVDDNITSINTKAIKNVVDTTAAGDSFNAGYLSSRLKGLTVTKSILKAQELAAKVIMFQGALRAK